MESTKIIERTGFLLAGSSLMMCLNQDRTPELWRSFMPLRNQIPYRTDDGLYALQHYAPNWSVVRPDPQAEFEKWAAVAVSQEGVLPSGLAFLNVPGGLYAVFRHQGPAHTFLQTAHHIFVDWMPYSGYTTDDRPHFEILREGYNPYDPVAEEDIWVPIRVVS